MAIGYPNGKKSQKEWRKPHDSKQQIEFGNRGMSLEDDLNDTNTYYLAQERAVIHKKPTPVQIVQVDYPKRSSAMIKEAYFKRPSTTDYNGVYNGKYLDFEAKETKSKTAFPLSNFHPHQIEHMKQVTKQEGIAFVITSFSGLGEVYLTLFDDFFPFWERMLQGGRKSITLDEIRQHSDQIPYGLNPRLDFLAIIDKKCF
ncbi:Holliday junction resolvase RecU [Listeria kieliensis]|uniref:Holliday junction resolvase RecU n=1 Tax=Listeria kieliensis TaxID=1621700 RepID=A0A3D8TU63_9LIST|nr:Holliday junction resolvase RecU [Listeria kieliensis]RDX02425.1 Holliday junction resolvase [Listeria kieliensis]